MNKYKPAVNITSNVAQTSSILLSANERQKKANSGYFPKSGAYWEENTSRKWTTTEKIMATLFAASIAAYGGHVLKNNEYVKKKTADFDAAITGSFDAIYHQLDGVPGYGNQHQIAAKTSPIKAFGAPNKTNITKNANVKEKKTYTYPQDTYQFTPDVKFFGNKTFHDDFWKNAPEDPRTKMTYEEAGQKALDELIETPDFTVAVNGAQMQVHDFVAKYMDEMHEGPEGNGPDGVGKIGMDYYPAIEASTMIHLAVHQSGIDVKYADSIYDREKNFRKWKYSQEEFATKIQYDWLAIKFKWTEPVRNELFGKAMKSYDNILHGDGR